MVSMGTPPVVYTFLKSLMGSLEDGSVVTWVWVWVLKFLMDSLGECFVAAFPKSLMGSLEDGSVVTWRGVLKSLMDLLGEGSAAAIPMSLMDSMVDGFVVTWRMALESDDCGMSSLPVKCASGLWFSFVAFFCERSYPQR